MNPNDKAIAEACIDEAIEVTGRLRRFVPAVVELADKVVTCFRANGKLLFCGNGGSASDGTHIATEFTGRFARERRPYPAMSLSSDPGLLTCIANDYDFDTVFSRQVQAHAAAGDLLFGLTTSGNSQDVIAALKIATSMNVQTVAFLGKGGGQAKGLADVEIIIDSGSPARIQEAHKLLLHTLCEIVDRKLEELG